MIFPFTRDNFVIRQYADCLTALGSAGFSSPASIPYNAAGGTVPITTSWSDIFTNQYSTDCPVTSCDLMIPDCSVALSSTDVVIGASPFGISASETNAAGYSVEFCF